MKLCRLIPLCCRLAAILLMAALMLAPGGASAHPGHGEAHGHGEARGHGGLMVPEASPSIASHAIHENLANALLPVDESLGSHPATLAAQPDGERGCAGWACCGSCHGCCIALLPGGYDPMLPRTGSRLTIALAGAPPGIGPLSLPEPPRPFR